MASSDIRYDSESVAFKLDGKRVVEISRDDAIIAPLCAIAPASIFSFERALKKYEDQDGAIVDYVFLTDVVLDEFDPDTAHRDICLSFIEDRLSVLVAHAIEENGAELDADDLLSPLLDREGAEQIGRYRDEQEGHLSEIYMLSPTDRNEEIGALYTLGVAAQALLDAAAGVGHLMATSARDLVAGGRVTALVGQSEASWIDAKAVPHRTDTDSDSFELAKDVAAFANTGRDALIIYGIKTADGPRGDVLDVVRPFKLSGLDAPALRQALGERLTPLLTDLEVGAIESGVGTGYGFGWIFIPAQPTWIRPVLVRGALVGERVRGSHFSVPFRVDEETRHWDASTVHSLIQAGRAALQQAGERDADAALPTRAAARPPDKPTP